MKKPKILVVGSFVMDLIAETNRFPQAGETVLGTGFSTASGGKGANQAVQAARLGAEVTMVGMVGQDAFGAEMIETVKAAGVNTSHVYRTDKASSAIGHIQIEKTADHVQNRILVVPGANMLLTPEDVAFLKEDIRQYDLVMLQLEIPLAVNRAVTRYALEANVPVMLNPAPYAPLTEEDYANVAFVSPNETEAAALLGFPIHSSEDAAKALKQMKEMGIRSPIITMGSQGAVWMQDDEMVFEKALTGLPVKDPTAAGDSFVSAFCTAFAAGCSIHTAMFFAKYTAGLTVCGMGAQPSLPEAEKVFEFLGKDMNSELEELREVLQA